ncbi:hypothetical protein BDB00DRAFT_845923 [Zychaea mexicana]|uniref:uncharacterized protein n=1 Tax=Zychaea mexicana TaxID=64656 RepID=UPI0022FE67AE|nr:uncharacterized protein BDB00DRAFT_845923 [Zychaea mexicana]KAI9488957.1 hypothetical protein BDB00DRAFT_845923 [Zychaea mexicana]
MLRQHMNSRTAWWRLLFKCLSNKEHLHCVFTSKNPANIFPFCETEAETLRHFTRCRCLTVSYAESGVGRTPTSSTTTYYSSNLRPMGTILQIVWTMHWRSVLDPTP